MKPELPEEYLEFEKKHKSKSKRAKIISGIIIVAFFIGLGSLLSWVGTKSRTFQPCVQGVECNSLGRCRCVR